MTMTLDAQIEGLESVPTSTGEQFKAKNSVLQTLRALKDLRRQFESGNPNEGKVVRLLLEVIGERPNRADTSS
jgi:hypothetical protein